MRWPAVYLGDDRDTALIVTGLVDGLIRRPNGDAEMPTLVEQALSRIAQGLNRDRVWTQRVTHAHTIQVFLGGIRGSSAR